MMFLRTIVFPTSAAPTTRLRSCSVNVSTNVAYGLRQLRVAAGKRKPRVAVGANGARSAVQKSKDWSIDHRVWVSCSVLIIYHTSSKVDWLAV